MSEWQQLTSTLTTQSQLSAFDQAALEPTRQLNALLLSGGWSRH